VLSQLHGETLQLLLEKPLAWEVRIFSKVLSDELNTAIALKRDLNYGVSFRENKELRDIDEV